MKRNPSTHGFTLLRRSAENGFTSRRRSAENGFTSRRRSAENGFTLLRRSAENGFTLVELLISVAIFAMIAAAGVSLLSVSVTAQGMTRNKLDADAETRRLVTLLSNDLAQIVARPTRDPSGRAEPAFQGGSDQTLLSYVRAGRSNPGERVRSGLERVTWSLADGSLRRTVRPHLDGTAQGQPVTFVSDVEALQTRFRNGTEWRDRWDATDLSALPSAVELTVKRRGSPDLAMRFLAGPVQ